MKNVFNRKITFTAFKLPLQSNGKRTNRRVVKISRFLKERIIVKMRPREKKSSNCCDLYASPTIVTHLYSGR